MWLRRAHARAFAFYASVALLLAAAVILRWAGPTLVVSVPPRDPDAILSLASHEWERLPAVAAIGRKYPSAVILLTLPSPATEQNCHRCADRPGRLRQAGIDADRIHILTDAVSNTRDEALASLRYATRAKTKEIIIITSPYHTRRALATFRRTFGATDVKLAIQPALNWSPASPQRWWRHGYDRAYVTYEWAAILYYAIRFGIYPWNA